MALLHPYQQIQALNLHFPILQVASTRFLGRHGKKLKSVTIIHSSTTETVRLPDGDGQGLIVHTAVR